MTKKISWREALALLLLLSLSTSAVQGQTTEDDPWGTTEMGQQQQQQQPVFEENNEFLGIPGTTQTLNGYDTALGNESICWFGTAAPPDDIQNNASSLSAGDMVDNLVKTVFPNPLVENFTLVGKTEILKRCPEGNGVSVKKPVENLLGERLRTLRYYNYSLEVDINLDTLDGDEILTDDGNAVVALQVVVCRLGLSGFCSPFVHEQANAREAIDKANSGQVIEETAKRAKGDLHGGTHIHSPWVFLDLGEERSIQTNVSIPLIVNHPGDYFVLGTIQLYTSINGTPAFRWDIANALVSLEGRYVLYQAPANIAEVSNAVKYASFVAIAVAASVIFYFMGQAIWHRDHQVMQLSQGTSLIVFAFCALVATISCFLLDPKNDDYCRIRYPMILIPIQFMYAITVARMWRIHAVISPLLLEHLNKGETTIAERFIKAITYVSFALINLFQPKEGIRRSTNGGLKQQISKTQLSLVIVLFALPQVILQIVAVFLQPQCRDIDFNDDESVGRATCNAHVDAFHDLITYSFILLILLVIVLLVMAHSSRKLPSLFNETRVIYDSTFLTLVLLLLGAAIIALTNSPSVDPDVEYLVMIFLVLSITLNSTVRILYPKLKMIWKNETVIVSKLVTDHHRKEREKKESRNGGSSKAMSNVTGLHGPEFDGSFTNTQGDYDQSQQQRFLTFHSDSADTRLNGVNKSSYVSSIERGSVTSFGEESCNMLGPTRESTASKSSAKDDFPDEYHLEPETDAMKQINLDAVPEGSSETKNEKESNHTTDIESGDSGSGGSRTIPPLSSQDEVEGKTRQESTETGNTDSGGFSDIKAEAVASVDSQILADEEAAVRKSVSFLDRRAFGFMKGITSWRGGSQKGFFAEGHNKSPAGSQAFAEIPETPESKSKPRADKQKSTKHLAHRIVVTEDETPARRLVLKMLDLHDQLEAVNNKIMSGVAVTQGDWAVITKLTSKLDRTFSNEVEFEWDICKQYEERLAQSMPKDMDGLKDFSHQHGGPGSTTGASDDGRDLEKGPFDNPASIGLQNQPVTDGVHKKSSMKQPSAPTKKDEKPSDADVSETLYYI